MTIFAKTYFVLLFITFLLYLIALKNKEQHVKIIFALITLWLLVSATAMYLSRYAGLKNNLFLFHICTPVEYMLLCLLYKDAIVNRYIKKIIVISIPLFFLLSMLFALYVQPLTENNSYVIMIESVMLVFLSLFFLREILLLQQVPVLHRFPMFWIAVGILCNYMGNLVIEGMMNYLMNHSMELALRMYRFGYIFKYLLFACFIIGALCTKYPVHKKKTIALN